MMKLIISFVLVLLACSCSGQISQQQKHPTEFIGTWKIETDKQDCYCNLKNYKNGKSVVIGMCYGYLYAYEAEWWVEGNIFNERITKFLYNDVHELPIGEMSKDKIIYMSKDRHILEEKLDTGTEKVTYLRVKDLTAIDRFQTNK